MGLGKCQVEPGSGEEPFEQARLVPHPPEPCLSHRGELGEISLGQVDQRPFQVGPDRLDRAELGGVGRELEDRQPFPGPDQFPHRPADVRIQMGPGRGGPVPRAADRGHRLPGGARVRRGCGPAASSGFDSWKVNGKITAVAGWRLARIAGARWRPHGLACASFLLAGREGGYGWCGRLLTSVDLGELGLVAEPDAGSRLEGSELALQARGPDSRLPSAPAGAVPGRVGMQLLSSPMVGLRPGSLLASFILRLSPGGGWGANPAIRGITPARSESVRARAHRAPRAPKRNGHEAGKRKLAQSVTSYQAS